MHTSGTKLFSPWWAYGKVLLFTANFYILGNPYHVLILMSDKTKKFHSSIITDVLSQLSIHVVLLHASPTTFQKLNTQLVASTQVKISIQST